MADTAAEQTGEGDNEQDKSDDERCDEDNCAGAIDLHLCHEVADVRVDQVYNNSSGISLHVAPY